MVDESCRWRIFYFCGIFFAFACSIFSLTGCNGREHNLSIFVSQFVRAANLLKDGLGGIF